MAGLDNLKELDSLKDYGFNLLDESEGTNAKHIGGQQARHPIFSYPRNVKTNAEQLSWDIPDASIPELDVTLAGLRGFILDFGVSLGLFNNTLKQMVCGTVGSVSGGVAVHHPAPLRDINYLTSGPDSKEPHRSIREVNPIGRRGFSCTQCIMNGKNKVVAMNEQGKPDPQKSSSCNPTMMVLFAVTEVATFTRNNKRFQLKWQKVSDLKDSDDEVMYPEGFVILNLRLSRSQASRPSKDAVFKGIDQGLDIPAAEDMLSFKDYVAKLHRAKNDNGQALARAIEHPSFGSYKPVVFLQPTELVQQVPTEGYMSVKGVPMFQAYTPDDINESFSYFSKALAEMAKHWEDHGGATYKSQQVEDFVEGIEFGAEDFAPTEPSTSNPTPTTTTESEVEEEAEDEAPVIGSVPDSTQKVEEDDSEFINPEDIDEEQIQSLFTV